VHLRTPLVVSATNTGGHGEEQPRVRVLSQSCYVSAK
jgi:hypothetical protein